MKQTLIITPNPDNKSATFTAAYKKDGKDVFITADPWGVHYGELPANKRPFRVQFGKYNSEYKINWDWDNLKDAQTRKIQEDVKQLLKCHPHMEVEGFANPNLINPMFYLRVLEDVEKKTYSLNKLFLQVINLVDNMTFKAKKDLVFFFGGNPTEFTEEQVWLDLIGFASGRLLNENNANIFMKSITPGQQAENNMRVYIKKAIHYQIIVTKDNKYWSKQNDLLGVTEDFVYQYYHGQPELYDFLKREVNKKEGIEEDVISEPDTDPATLPPAVSQHVAPQKSKHPAKQ